VTICAEAWQVIGWNLAACRAPTKWKSRWCVRSPRKPLQVLRSAKHRNELQLIQGNCGVDLFLLSAKYLLLVNNAIVSRVNNAIESQGQHSYSYLGRLRPIQKFSAISLVGNSASSTEECDQVKLEMNSNCAICLLFFYVWAGP